MGPIAGVCRATLAGTMKMPDPMTDPTMVPRAASGPRTRGRSCMWSGSRP